jgi:hypothetical protein
MVVKLKPTWDDTSKPGNDRNGYKRGFRGVDNESGPDTKVFMKTFDRKADDFMYGKSIRNVRPDGAQRVMTSSADPGTITNRKNNGTSAGYDGVDE